MQNNKLPNANRDMSHVAIIVAFKTVNKFECTAVNAINPYVVRVR